MRRTAGVLSVLVLTLLMPSPVSAADYSSGSGGCSGSGSAGAGSGTPRPIWAAGGAGCTNRPFVSSSIHGWGIVPDGTDCSHQEFVPTTFTAGSNGDWTVTWQDPGRGRTETFTGTPAHNSQQNDGPLPDSIYLTYSFAGSFQGGRCVGSYSARPQSCTPLVAGPGSFWDQFGWCPLALPAVTGAITPQFLGPYVANWAGYIKDLLYPGNVKSSPATRGTVGVPECYWLEGTTLPGQQWYEVDLPGPSSSLFASILYVIQFRVSFQNLTWDFGDGDSSTAPILPEACRNTARWQQTAHTYRRISEGSAPGDRYQVTATLHYLLDNVTAFWIDSRGSQAQALGGTTSFEITSPPHPQYIGQIEGIPVNQ